MFSWLVMHVIGALPVWVWIVLALVGGAGYFFSGLIFAFLPFLLAYKEPFKIACVAICLGSTFMCGGAGVTAIWQEQIKEANARIAVAEAKSKETNIVIQKEYVDRIQTVKQIEVQIQERIVKDATKIDAVCKVAPEAIADLNAAAMPRSKK